MSNSFLFLCGRNVAFFQTKINEKIEPLYFLINYIIYCDGSEGGFSSEQFRNLTVQALVSEYRIRKEVLGSEQRLGQSVVDSEKRIRNEVLNSESRIRNEVLDSEQRLGEKVIQLHSETQDLISRRSQMVLDGLKEVDENITKLAHQMDNAKLELAKAIDLVSLQTSYHEDFEHYDLFERKFSYLNICSYIG